MSLGEASKRRVPLTALREGESGTVISILKGPGRERRHGVARRIMEMGLTPGTKVVMISSAPFHGPVEIDVRGTRLAIGRGVSEKIIVEVDEKSG